MNAAPESRRLRMSMSAGAWYDAIVGASIVVALPQLSNVLSIPLPAEPFYARMQGVLLMGLGLLYALAAVDLERHLRIVAAAIVIRLVGGGYLAASVPLQGIDPFFYAFAGMDLLFALIHLTLLKRERKARFWPLLLHGQA